MRQENEQSRINADNEKREQLDKLESELVLAERTMDEPYVSAHQARNMLNRVVREPAEMGTSNAINPQQILNFNERVARLTDWATNLEVSEPIKTTREFLTSHLKGKKESARVWVEIALRKLAANEAAMSPDAVTHYKNELAELQDLVQ